MFDDAIRAAVNYKKNPTDFTDQVIVELNRMIILDECSNKALSANTDKDGDDLKKTDETGPLKEGKDWSSSSNEDSGSK